MKKKWPVILLASAALGLLAVCVWIFWNEDREPPVITVSGSEITYDGSDRDALLEGVTARDDVDGTAQVAVERIIDEGNGRAKVLYVAKDRAGNMAKASRVVKLAVRKDQTDIQDEVPETSPEETAEEFSSLEVNAEQSVMPSYENPEAPVLELTAHEAIIGQEETFRYMSYINSITDDKDDRDTLYKRIRAEGAQEAYPPGEYEITYFVTDTDGNRSNTEVLKLMVQ
ncbi:VOC family protein [Lacrimispora sp. NSJ-141]|uniref:VOC family protein n=1 Tax=Lientehia hominis TaxID=2897778 RepID=A0AAP2RIK9_9FIRM|nr:VOC family protein [Lientehia hominis]MCD2492290.1 VOC family protein [Lientehia hominis]